MRISLTDPRLSPTERHVLRNVAEKLRQPPRAPLPRGYQEEIDRVTATPVVANRKKNKEGAELSVCIFL